MLGLKLNHVSKMGPSWLPWQWDSNVESIYTFVKSLWILWNVQRVKLFPVLTKLWLIECCTCEKMSWQLIRKWCPTCARASATIMIIDAGWSGLSGWSKSNPECLSYWECKKCHCMKMASAVLLEYYLCCYTRTGHGCHIRIFHTFPA